MNTVVLIKQVRDSYSGRKLNNADARDRPVDMRGSRRRRANPAGPVPASGPDGRRRGCLV